MTIAGFILLVVVLGVVLWLVCTYIPMPQPIKTVLVVAVVIIIVVLLIDALGLFGVLNAPIPRVRG
jgi:hypothetical protein